MANNISQFPVRRSILEANMHLSKKLRQHFYAANVKVINIIASPGAGKTTLLEKIIPLLSNHLNIAVIEGDIQTINDAQRVSACGVNVVQIETKGACHLDSYMISEAIKSFDLNVIDLLIIENIGNLVCPVEFDLGENLKIAIFAVTEGDDKPNKYPLLFSEAGVLIVNKIDLLPYIDCDLTRVYATCRALNSTQLIFNLSCRTGEGIQDWVNWLENWVRNKKL